MKLAVLADIHANLPALQTVIADVEAWAPDLVIVAGDVVNRGPRPGECLRLIQEKQQAQGWRLVRGNHEDYVIKVGQLGEPRSGPAFEVHRPSYWTYQQLGCDLKPLEAMPFQQSFLGPDGREARTVHASMLGNRDGIYPETTDAELEPKVVPVLDPPPALFCVGHTHRALVRRLNSTLVVNAGSVGLPFDGDHRAGYARCTWQDSSWFAEIIRLKYDREGAERDFYDTGYLEEGGPLIQLVQVELQTARSMLFSWAIRYQDRAARGEITMQESVRDFLARRQK